MLRLLYVRSANLSCVSRRFASQIYENLTDCAGDHWQIQKFGSRIYPDITNCVGNTPIVRLDKIAKEEGIKCELLAKCEYLNPGGSLKDRPAILELERAVEAGKIDPTKTVIVCPTLGNAGISLAMVCAVKGYRCALVMPDRECQEKLNIINALGAHVVRAPSVTDESSPESYQNVARRLAENMENAFFLDQYSTQDNTDAHYNTTGAEILDACDGELDAVVIGAGSGATLSGVGRRLKEHNPEIQVIAVHTEGSILDDPTLGGFRKKIIEGGVGHTFVPEVLDRSVIDQWIRVSNELTFTTARQVIRREGLLCGGSSGAVVAACVQVGRSLGQGRRVLGILDDGVRNYLRQFLSDDWFKEQGWYVDDLSSATLLPDRPIGSWDFGKLVQATEKSTVIEALRKVKLNPHAHHLLVTNAQGFVLGIIPTRHLEFRHKNAEYLSSIKFSDYATIPYTASARTVGPKLKNYAAVLILKKGIAATKRPNVEQVSGVISSVSLMSTVFGHEED